MARRYVPDNDEPDDGKHSWAETRAYHPNDEFLRRHGFRIWGRPRGGEASWKAPTGEILGQAVALAAAYERVNQG